MTGRVQDRVTRMRRQLAVLLAATALGCATTSIAPDIGNSEWRLAELEGALLMESVHTPSIRFGTPPPRISGSAGCNAMSADYVRDGQNLSFGLVALTKRACAAELMQLENQFVAVLSGVTRYTVSEGMLLLYAGDRLVARLRRSG